MQQVLGVDLGKVVIGPRPGGIAPGDPGFVDAQLARAEVEDAIDVLAALSRGRFDGRMFVVSKRGLDTRSLALEWLRRKRFFERLGIRESHVRFCATQEAKAPICAELGITHFVDNRLGVLRHLSTVPNRYLLNGEREETGRYPDDLDGVIVVSDWRGILAALL